MIIPNMDLLQQKIDNARAAMQEATQDNDDAAFAQAQQDLMQATMEKLLAEHDNGSQMAQDAQVLASRGVRQLTSEETGYYQKVIDAMKSNNPKQALGNIDAVMPTTVVDAVFDDLTQNHPLLSRINFQPTNGLIEMIMNTDVTQLAKWGSLCAEIDKELSSGFKKINTSLYKLSAFIPVCKAMLDLGPAWLDRYVRSVLSEALACGMENGIINGDGYEMPVGMIRQVGEGVSVVGGHYPEKAPITVTSLDPVTIGNLLSIMAMGANGKTRVVTDVILLVNGQDYYQKVMPATTLMAPDGSYRNDVLPYPMTVIPTFALPRGKAVIGIANKYFAAAGMAKDGRIEYSDDYRFLEDERVYLIKTYANGMPKDNNAFLVLDISALKPATWKVTQVTEAAKSTTNKLASLSMGSAALAPAFDASVDTYTATTTNATNVVNAVPADAGAAVEVKLNGAVMDNGSAANWVSGENTLAIKVTAEDGVSTKTYTVTVTKN